MSIAEISFARAVAASLISDALGNLSGISYFHNDTVAREDRSIAVTPTCSEPATQRTCAQFRRGSSWPELVAVSGLNLRVRRALLKCPVLGSHGRVVTCKAEGKSVALDTLPDPRMPNEDLWFCPKSQLDVAPRILGQSRVALNTEIEFGVGYRRRWSLCLLIYVTALFRCFNG